MIFKRFLTNMQKKNSFRFFENRWSNPIDDRTSTNLLHNFVKINKIQIIRLHVTNDT